MIKVSIAIIIIIDNEYNNLFKITICNFAL